MSKYKIVFPAGYIVEDMTNDNIDINVVRNDGKIFFATLFTIDNIRNLMIDNYFWAADMIVVSDLNIDTIKHAVRKIINNNYFESAFDFIGDIETKYGHDQNFEHLKLDPFFLTIDL